MAEYRDVKLRVEMEFAGSANMPARTGGGASGAPAGTPTDGGAGRGDDGSGAAKRVDALNARAIRRAEREAMQAARLDAAVEMAELRQQERERRQAEKDARDQARLDSRVEMSGLRQQRREQREQQQTDRETERAERAAQRAEQAAQRATRQWTGRATDLGRSAIGAGGPLSGEVESLIGALASEIPGGATAFKLAQLSERYGPAAAAAAEAGLPPGVREAAGAVRTGVESAVRVLASARATLDSLGVAFETAAEAAGTEMIFNGKTDNEALLRIFQGTQAIEQERQTAFRMRQHYDRQAVGAAIGSAMADGLDEVRKAAQSALAGASGK